MIRTAELSRFGAVAFSFSGIAQRLRLWRDLAAERRALARLSEDQLRDMGVTADRADREAGRVFWDAPTNRVRAGLL